jgi:hypothetical protein
MPEEQEMKNEPESLDEFIAEAKKQRQLNVRIAIVGVPDTSPFRIRVEAYNRYFFDTVTHDLDIMKEYQKILTAKGFKVVLVERQFTPGNKIPTEIVNMMKAANKAGIKKKRRSLR